MRPTDILTDEHRVIEVGLECLERLSAQAVEAGRLERQVAEDALDFIRGFADRCHHGKEEERLFTAMVSKGIPRDQGPIAVMLDEHEKGRAFVRGMADSVDAASKGDREALSAFAGNARGYVELLRGHIAKEDRVLFPMADQMLSADEQKTLLEEFKTAEAELMAGTDTERFFLIIHSLAERFGVSGEPIDRARRACGRFLSE